MWRDRHVIILSPCLIQCEPGTILKKKFGKVVHGGNTGLYISKEDVDMLN
jgi:hypothetical protein